MRVNIYEEEKTDIEHVDIYCRRQSEKINDIASYIRESNTDTIIGLLDNKQQVLSKNSIIYFESVDKKCYAYTKTNVYQIHLTLNGIEEKSLGKEFVRISKSTIVNIYKVRSIRADMNMRTIATLVNKEQVVISRHYSKVFKTCLYDIRDQMKEVKR